MHLGFDWDTTDMSIMLLAKLAKPLLGAARIVINSIHIKGDVSLMPYCIDTSFCFFLFGEIRCSLWHINVSFLFQK